MVILSEISESSSSSTTTYQYDVFLSFRGADTRYGFTDHLYKALMDAAIETFYDDDEIQTGEDLKPKLENAIKASRASIIVLSKDYASSTWCLDELVLILEQRRTIKHIVIPIFFHVKPTDVRKQRNSFGDAMERYKQKMEEEPNEKKRSQWAEKIKKWEKALAEVADLKGEEANGRRETILIERIVKELNKRRKVPYLVGMEYSVRTVISSLKNDTTEFLTVWGMVGIGKTYLANYVFNLHYHDFERSSFLEHIERRCMQPYALLDLQKQLLNDIGDMTWMDIHNVNAATTKIEKLLLRNKTLLVLDGIDHFEQLDVLIGTRGLHPGSKIIITTKDASLTEKCRLFMTEFPPNHMKHLLEGLNEEDSQQLLGLCAFNGDYPNESYREQARKIVEYCGGHPLALTILGSSLRNEDVVAWKDTIRLLQNEPNHQILHVLQTSFDSLPSENDKELFKHIACFFVGKDREITETILRECDLFPTFGFSKLIDRGLLKVGKRNELMMHKLLQELGRDLVRQESPNEPWERSRIWHHEESYDVLKQEKGTSKIQGLVLDMKMIGNYAPLGIRTNAFNTMDKLRLLQLDYVQLHGSYKHFPAGLRWLSMHGFPLNNLPLELQLENIVALDMSYSSLQHLWEKPKLLRSLKVLILRFCHELVSVGGFDGFPLLERLILAGCSSLVEISESIGNCDKLLLLDLSECGRLKTKLVLDHCVSLEKVALHPEASLLSLTYHDTKTLTEIEGVLKKQAISEIDEEMVCRLGWINRHVKDEKFSTMSDFLKAHGKTFIVQHFGGRGIFTTYFRGNRLPDWVTHISCSRELRFTLPLYGKSCRIRGLNVCFVATIVSNKKDVVFPRTVIRNLTKRYPDNIYIYDWWVAPESNEEGDIVWLSHLTFENNEFENGDEVIVHVDCIHLYDEIHLKEYGVSVVYDDDDDDDDGHDDDDDDGNKRQDSLADYKPWKLNIGGAVVFAPDLSVLDWKRPN